MNFAFLIYKHNTLIDISLSKIISKKNTKADAATKCNGLIIANKYIITPLIHRSHLNKRFLNTNLKCNLVNFESQI